MQVSKIFVSQVPYKRVSNQTSVNTNINTTPPQKQITQLAFTSYHPLVFESELKEAITYLSKELKWTEFRDKPKFFYNSIATRPSESEISQFKRPTSEQCDDALHYLGLSVPPNTRNSYVAILDAMYEKVSDKYFVLVAGSDANKLSLKQAENKILQSRIDANPNLKKKKLSILTNAQVEQLENPETIKQYYAAKRDVRGKILAPKLKAAYEETRSRLLDILEIPEENREQYTWQELGKLINTAHQSRFKY